MPFMTYRDRAAAAEDTQSATPAIISHYASRGASSTSTFLTLSSLPPLQPSASPGFTGKKVRVVAADSFEAARMMISSAALSPKAKRRSGGPEPLVENTIAVLNLASDMLPGGGWPQTLCETQEEALCYSSTLYATLLHSQSRYPWRNTGPGSDAGIFSPGVVVWKDTLSHALLPLPESQRMVVSVLTVAAPCAPALKNKNSGNTEPEFKEQSVLEDMRNKVRLVYRMAARHGKTRIVLGAMGCGAYRCPQWQVAEVMRDVLLEKEWAGWFEEVWVAVLDPMGEGNLGVFGEVMDGVPLGEVELEGEEGERK